MASVILAMQRTTRPHAARPLVILVLQLASSAALLSAAPQPFASTRLEPEITFSLDDGPRGADHEADQADEADGLDGWRVMARKAAGLQTLECSEKLLGATGRDRASAVGTPPRPRPAGRATAAVAICWVSIPLAQLRDAAPPDREPQLRNTTGTTLPNEGPRQ